jgi:hypothetical protein
MTSRKIVILDDISRKEKLTNVSFIESKVGLKEELK